MATKTEKLRKGLIALGYATIETKSSRECFAKEVAWKNRAPGEVKQGRHYVWLLTGALRASSDPTIGSAQSCSSAWEAKVIAAGEAPPTFF